MHFMIGPVFLLLTVTASLAGEVYEAVPFPLQENEENGSILPLTMVNQVIVSGSKIYLGSIVDKVIGVIDTKGRILEPIGTPGEGPGEFRGGIAAMAVYKNHLWVVNMADHGVMFHFVDGRYVESIRGLSPKMIWRSPNFANNFAASKDTVVYPGNPNHGALAFAYRPDEPRRPVGELLFTPDSERDLLEKNNAMNDTFWAYEDPYWFCAFTYYPVIYKFDRKFKMIDSFSLSTPSIDEAFDKMVNKKPEGPGRPNQRRNIFPIISDFKARKGKLYVLAQGILHQMDRNTGALLNRAAFTVRNGRLRGRPFRWRSFDITDKGTIVFGSFLSNMDAVLYKAELPFPSN
ncbi:MAG: hypothetical protein QNK37_36435 [Acidobacteriota bacterium]|nr:hypothetical protein [Acidobacteriota bacterium]